VDVIGERRRIEVLYTMLYEHDNVEMDTTCDKFLKIHMIRMSDTFRTQDGSMLEVSVLHRLYIFTTRICTPFF